MGLTQRGWARGPVVDNGFYHTLTREAGGLTLTLRVVEGLSASGHNAGDEVGVTCLDARADSPDSVALSEIVRDLTWLIAA